MYASVRVYRLRPENRKELNRRVNEEFVPLVSKLPGYAVLPGSISNDGHQREPEAEPPSRVAVSAIDARAHS